MAKILMGTTPEKDFEAVISDACSTLDQKGFELQEETVQWAPGGIKLGIERTFVHKTNPKKYPIMVFVNSENGVMVANAMNKTTFLAPLRVLLTNTEFLKTLLDEWISNFQNGQ